MSKGAIVVFNFWSSLHNACKGSYLNTSYMFLYRININMYCWVLEWMHSIILLYNFIAYYLNGYSFGCMPWNIFYIFPIEFAWNPSIAVYHNLVILMHVIVDQIYIIQKVAIILDLHKGIEIWIVYLHIGITCKIFNDAVFGDLIVIR